MSTRIPLPGNMIDTLMGGLKTGSGLYANAMHPILEREKQKQLEQHFQEQLKLSKAAAGRNSQLFPFRLQELKDKHAAAEFERNMMSQLMGGSAPTPMGGEGVGQGMPGAPQMPTEEMGQGQGAFTPEGLGQAQQMAQQAQQPQAQAGGATAQNPMFHALMQNPMMRGWFKHKFGYDPLAPIAQTPAEKMNDQINLFKTKEQIKAQNKGGDTPTNTVLTQNQQAIQGIDTVLPMLDELINNPEKVYGATDFSPSKKAAYNAKTSGMIDTLVAAQSLPKVQASIDLVEQQIRRATNESTKSYIKRLKDLRKDLVGRRGKSQSVLKNRKVNTSESDDFSNMSLEELQRIAAGGG